MKKVFIGLSLLLMSTSILLSQTINNYGIKVGYVSSNQDFSNNDIDNTTKRKNGFSFSAFIDLFNFSGFSISPEIKYIQKGVGFEMILTGPDSPEPIGKKSYYIYNNYLSIPIALIYKVELNAGTPFVKIAPRYDILLNSDDEFNLLASTDDDFKNVFGGTFSVGFVPNLNIVFNPFIEISYHMDFMDTYSERNNRIRNNAVEINLGIHF